MDLSRGREERVGERGVRAREERKSTSQQAGPFFRNSERGFGRESKVVYAALQGFGRLPRGFYVSVDLGPVWKQLESQSRSFDFAQSQRHLGFGGVTRQGSAAGLGGMLPRCDDTVSGRLGLSEKPFHSI